MFTGINNTYICYYTTLYRPVSPLPSAAPSELVESFSNFFNVKIQKIRDQITNSTGEDISNTEDVPVDEHLISRFDVFENTSEDEIKKLIVSSKSTTCSLDSIPTEILKKCLNQTLPTLTKLYNLSLRSGVVPNAFKRAIIKPLLKKHNLDINELKSFRPISNLSFLSKILEKIVDQRLRDHLSSNNLYNSFQSAYRPFHSTETALLRISNDILLELDSKRAVILVLLDLSAAFDTIDHNILLRRLKNVFGIDGVVLQWFKSYISDRTQTVSIEGADSSSTPLRFGVPQGSVLGPVLFSMYTTPLARVIENHGFQYHFYADDTQLYLSFNPKYPLELEDSIKSVENCIISIHKWMSANFLKLNEDKTEILIITSKHFKRYISDVSFSLGNSIVTPGEKAKNIGIIVDDQFNLKSHIGNICKSSCYQLRCIGAIRKHLTRDACLTLIHSFITSKIDYCNSLYFGLPEYQLKRLQSIINSAARIVSLLPKSCHITPVLRNLHWLPIHKRIEYKILLLVYKCLHGLAPAYLSQLISLHNPPRILRSSSTLSLSSIRTNTTYGCRAFSSSAPMLWNSLPVSLQTAPSLSLFKVHLKTHLFVQAFG